MDIDDAGKTLVHAALLEQAKISPEASAPGLTMRVTSRHLHCIMSSALWTCAKGRTHPRNDNTPDFCNKHL